MPDSPRQRNFNVHIINAAGRVFIFSTMASSPDQALERLQAAGDYIPEANDRVTKIQPGPKVLHVSRDDS